MKSRQDGTTIARALSDAGASRLGQTFLSIPPDSTEILSSISFYQPQSISFVASQDDLTNEYLYPVVWAGRFLPKIPLSATPLS
jgi:hypothetical protein